MRYSKATFSQEKFLVSRKNCFNDMSQRCNNVALCSHIRVQKEGFLYNACRGGREPLILPRLHG